MKSLKNFFLALIISLSLIQACDANDNIRVGIMGFSSNIKSLSPQNLVSITDAFIHMFSNSKSITVIERQQLEALTREHNLSMAGLIDPAATIEAGKLSGCQYILNGNITRRGRSIMINANIIHVSSGKSFYLSERTDSSELQELLNASSRLGNKIREELAGEYAYIVAARVDGSEIIINRGNTALVQPGNFYRIYNEWQELNESGDLLVSEGTLYTENIAVVEVIETSEKFSVAKIIENGGDPSLILQNDRAAPITKAEKDALISMKKFTPRRHHNLNKMTDSKIRRAEEGDSGQMVVLGLMYFRGFGVKQDFKKAFEWWTRVAELKNTNAYMNLAAMYFDGIYVIKDVRKGLELYLKAEEETHYFGWQHMLGDLYMGNNGVKPDYKKAAYWYSKAAEQNFSSSQSQLAYLYSKGLGVELDYKKAFDLYKKAAHEDPNAMNNLANMYLNGLGVSKDERKAFEWNLKAAEHGDLEAINSLGMMYANGIGVAQNYEKAIEYLLEAVEEDYPPAMNNLGIMYLQGQGVEKDYKKAQEYFIQAIEHDNGNNFNIIKINLGYTYELQGNIEKAHEWYNIAAQKITSEEINDFRRLVSEGNNRSPKSFLKYFDEIFSKK